MQKPTVGLLSSGDLDDASRVPVRFAELAQFVNAVNDPPVALDDSVMTDEDTPVTIDVTANDSDVDGNLDVATVSVTVAPAHGSTAVNPATGAVIYSPALNMSGRVTRKRRYNIIPFLYRSNKWLKTR